MMLASKIVFCDKIVRENSSISERRSTQDKIYFPLFLIKLGNDSCYTIKQDDNYSRICIFSDRSFDVVHAEDILKEILKSE